MLDYPTLDDIKSALFVQPHPDDNEIGAGGTMAYLVQKGIPVYSVSVTKGDGGSDEHSPEALASIRALEAQHASDILGVTYLGDLGYTNTNPGTISSICEDIVNIMRTHHIQTLISVDPDLDNECHPVHLTVGRAVNEAFVRCPQRYYPFHEHRIHDDAYHPEILGHYFTKHDNTIVGIDAVYTQKMDAIRAHSSQVNEAFLQQLNTLYQAYAIGTPYTYAERLKLLYPIHTHCFAIRDELLESLMESL
ncbi:hypothetical protein AOC36_08925 [Erysipelothrix larvae]|uniref:GlcNAc-PI de-N-acetylase n=1 Tax=Erysipelothrix larvae TaxID=1514105 RepID=A0A0X8H117_9FIRM|nr:PIG-L deacetylase family protein [Erysipelothrix larvae]AMC94106.1 hypothetical protein AOC36_08925 [Erysipelothrix larvae]